MGMIANYELLSDEQLEELKNFDPAQFEENLEIMEEWNSEADCLLDIDKMWDVLHFVLTGTDSSKPEEKNPLSEAVLGEVNVESPDYVAYTNKERIPLIVSALEKFDIEKAMENFDVAACKRANLYPNIWDLEDEEELEELKEEIVDYFENMKDFYNSVLRNKGNVMVTIF